VAAFGAFVDIGVHQDGLVHVSAMSRNFVSDPHQVVKSGDVVRVRVLGVDIPRKRISLTLRLDEEAPGRGGGLRREPGRTDAAPHREAGREGSPPRREARRESPAPRGQEGGSMADALRRAGLAGNPSDQRRKGRRG
jgi:protein Tex